MPTAREDPGARKLTIAGRDRLDKELCEVLSISRETAKRLIHSGRVRIRGETHHHPARRLGKPTEVEILEKPERAAHAAGMDFSKIQLEILFEDEALLAINKPAGLSVHPGAGHEQDTLVDLLRAKKIPLAGMSDPSRAGLVHRLDKDTSGILLIAKKPAIAEHLMLQFAERKVDKEYRAVIRGQLPRRSLRIVGAIGRSPTDRKKFSIQHGGREAVTVIEALGQSPTSSLVKVIPKTGRTHQIRVHLKHAGFPIIGDPVYGLRVPGVNRMLLHAYKLIFTHPLTGARLQMIAPLPKDFVMGLIHLGFQGFD